MPVVHRVDLGHVEVLTMRELTLHTARVIEQVRKEGRPRAIVKHGRFQAALWPLEDGCESQLLASVIHSGDLVIGDAGEGMSVDALLVEEASRAPDPVSSQKQHRKQLSSTVSMTEVNQSTSSVIERVRDGQRLVITKHGRFLAYLAPLPHNLEATLVASMLRYDPAFGQTLDFGSRDGVGHGWPADVAEGLVDM